MNLMSSWESFTPEKINQKCCRLLLSVHKKTSRLAVLGELGRHPLFIKSVSHCINYKLSLEKNKDPKSILGSLMVEMRTMADQNQDCWLTRVQKLEKLTNCPKISGFSKTSGKTILAALKLKFEQFWLEKVNEVKLGPDNLNHNKLRTYSKLKHKFGPEPYINLVRNRSHRMHSTRLRTSAHNLNIERGRYQNIPLAERICKYCSTPTAGSSTSPTQPPPCEPSVDSEFHFLIQCQTLAVIACMGNFPPWTKPLQILLRRKSLFGYSVQGPHRKQN